MAKTRGAHTFRPQVRQGPSPPATSPSHAAAGSFAASIVATGPSAAVGADPSAPAARSTSAPTVVAPAASDAEGSSSVAPAQRRYHTRVGPYHQLLHISDQPEGPHRPRGPGHQAQGSRLHRDPGRRPLHLIRVLP